MLILTRRFGEALRIGNDIEIKILGMNGNQTRLGIEAPKDIEVHREEVFQRIKKNSGKKSEVKIIKKARKGHKQ